MKRLFTSLVFIALTLNFFAQVPQKMSYQAVIRNSSGALVTNHIVRMRISILQSSATGTPVYVETQTPTTNANGLATMEIGGGTIITGTFAGINWSTGTYFIKTETDPTGGSSYTIIGTSQILSVPYALYARVAGSAVDAVTLSSDQTITGSKTFAKDILVNGLTVGKAGGGVSTNTALGISALKSNTTGPNNTSLGLESLYKNTTGYSNTSVGYRSLYSSTIGGRNTAIGDSTLFSNTSGGDNTATGAYALHLNTSGYWNTGNGYQSLVSNTTGIGNTAIGYKAFRSGKAGNYNTAVGYHAGYSNAAGSSNVFIGSSSGYYETGSNKLFIDNQQRASETDARNKALVYGIFNSDPGSQVLTFNGNVGISSSNPGAKLEVSLQNSMGWKGNLKALRINAPDLAYYLELNASIIGAGNAGYSFNPNGNPGLTISTPGNVGIGTSTPSSKLDVNGEINVNSNKIINVADPASAQDAATKAYVDAILSKLSTTGAILADADGNIYSTVRLGSQVWMVENLKTTKFRNGTDIPLVTDNTAWANLITPGYCWYNNNSANKDTYGALYNWYTVNTGYLCPEGWHPPTDPEWLTLVLYLMDNGYNYDGTSTSSKLGKALASTSLWTSTSVPGAVGNTDYPAKRNATGFTALPGGSRYLNGTFNDIRNFGRFWFTTEYNVTNALSSALQYDYIGSFFWNGNKKEGYSVRCLRD